MWAESEYLGGAMAPNWAEIIFSAVICFTWAMLTGLLMKSKETQSDQDSLESLWDVLFAQFLQY